MPRGLQQIRQGMRALFRETGESFLVGGVRITGLRQDRELIDPLNGVVRMTEITVNRSSLSDIPKKGSRIRMGDVWGIINQVRPAGNGTVVLEVTATV